jgi:hypothetical protein
VNRRPPASGRTADLEQRIMDLWEGGLHTPAAIAAMLNERDATVNRILGYMRETAGDRKIGDKANARATEALLAAIQQRHPQSGGAQA